MTTHRSIDRLGHAGRATGQSVRVLPDVIILECDYGAVWPTWTPADHESSESARTAYLPFDDLPLPDDLRDRLRRWQNRWLEVTGPPERVDFVPLGGEWNGFLAEGRSLVSDLQRALGDSVEVRFGFEE